MVERILFSPGGATEAKQDQGQTLATNTTRTLTSADCSPGSPWVSGWDATRGLGFVRILTVLAASSTSVGGTFTFEFSENGTTATISEARPIDDFDTVRDFDLINAGAYYRVKFEPALALGGASVFVTTTLRKQDDGAFVRLANQEIEEANAAMPQAFAFLKAFDEVTGKSVNIRPTFSGTDAENQLGTPLGAGGVFTGQWREVAQHGSLIFLYAIAPSTEAPATVQIQYSDDQSTVLSTSTLAAQTFTAGPVTYAIYLSIVNGNYPGAYARPKITNGGVAQTATPISLWARNQYPFNGTFAGLDSALSLFSQALLVRAVNAGVTPDNAFKNLRNSGSHAANSTTTALNGGEVWRGDWFEWQEGFTRLQFGVTSDVSGTLYVDFSQETAPVNGDESSLTDTSTNDYDPSVAVFMRRTVVLQSRWVRLRYVNGPTAQSALHISAAFVTTDTGVGLLPYAVVPRKDMLGGMVRAVTAVETTDGLGYQEVTGRPDGSVTETIVAHEVETPIKPLNQIRVGQGSVTSGLAIPLPAAGLGLANRKTIEYSNHSDDVDVFYGPSDAVTAVTGKLLRAGSDVAIELDETVDLYFIAETSGSTLTTNKAPGSVGGTATSPSNVIVGDNVYASETIGQTVIGAPPSYSLALAAITGLQIGVEARKAPTPTTATVLPVATVTGTTGNTTSVTSGTVISAADNFYLMAVTWRNAAANPSSVTGLGLTWTLIGDVTGSGALSRTAVYKGVGTPTGDSTVVAAFSAAITAAVIGVTRFTGVDATTPIQNSETLNDPAQTASYSDAIVGTALGLAYTAVGARQRTVAPGSGFTEQAEAASGTEADLSVSTLSLAASGSQAYSGTLSGNTGWSVVALTLIPAIAPEITLLVEYDVNGGGYVSAGSLTFDAESTKYVDISGTHPRTEAAINQTSVRLTRTSAGAAPAEIDRLFLAVTEGTADSGARISYAEIADTTI